jgi:alpha-galactosidase
MESKMKTLKIVLIGAGSREFSRGLVNDLILEKGLWRSFNVELALCDIDEDALDIMEGYALRAVKTSGSAVTIIKSTDRKVLLPDADFVLLAVELKRMELWEQDFRVPLGLGMKHIYGENGGPGALFHTLRNYENIFPILTDMETFCPQAFLINFTNPEARILTAILKTTKIRAIGLCHGFYDFYNFTSKVLDRDYEELDIRTAGMNHFFSYYKIADKLTGKDLIPIFEEKIRENPEILPPLTRYFWETFGALGIDSDHHMGEYVGFGEDKFDALWEFGFDKNRVLPSTRVDSYLSFQAWRYHIDVRDYVNKKPGGHIDELVEGRADITLRDIVSSGELAIPVIADIMLDRNNWRPAVNVLNTEGYIPNLSVDGCIEVPARFNKAGIHPETVPPLNEGFAAQIRLQHTIQKLTLEAWEKKSKKYLLQALLLDPVVRSTEKAERLIKIMFDLQSDYLPEFHN